LRLEHADIGLCRGDLGVGAGKGGVGLFDRGLCIIQLGLCADMRLEQLRGAHLGTRRIVGRGPVGNPLRLCLLERRTRRLGLGVDAVERLAQRGDLRVGLGDCNL
jgi:hypothetical protein